MFNKIIAIAALLISVTSVDGSKLITKEAPQVLKLSQNGVKSKGHGFMLSSPLLLHDVQELSQKDVAPKVTGGGDEVPATDVPTEPVAEVKVDAVEPIGTDVTAKLEAERTPCKTNLDCISLLKADDVKCASSVLTL